VASGATADGEQIGFSELLGRSNLSAVDKRRVCNALVNGMIEGWTPDRQTAAHRRRRRTNRC
jgi:hypothetical protein